MLSTRACRILAVLVVLFAVGTAAAAERGVTTRASERHDLALQASNTQAAAGPASAVRLLRLRLLETLRLIRDLDAKPEPPSFGTDGLSDGPDPIDAEENPGDTGPAHRQGDTSNSKPANGRDSSTDMGLGPR